MLLFEAGPLDRLPLIPISAGVRLLLSDRGVIWPDATVPCKPRGNALFRCRTGASSEAGYAAIDGINAAKRAEGAGYAQTNRIGRFRMSSARAFLG